MPSESDLSKIASKKRAQTEARSGYAEPQPSLCNTYVQKSICAKRKIVFRRKNFFLQENNSSFGAELFTRFKCLNIKHVDGGKNSYRFSVKCRVERSRNLNRQVPSHCGFRSRIALTGLMARGGNEGWLCLMGRALHANR